jgi:O-antigen ligase
MAMAQPEHFGTVYRTVRLAGFVATLWLLTPWWGRRDLLLLRCHLGAIAIILGSVLLGVLAAPSTALSQGRLSGTLWPLPPTDVAHFSAVMTGLVVVLWFCGKMRGRVALPIALVATTILLLTHTRTALVGMIAGILVAGLSLVLAKARVRKLFVAGGALVLVGLITFSSAVTHWLDRGEGTQQLSSLTGRTSVWSAVVTDPRDKFEVIFGFGLSNKSFNGLPIDSNWLAAYLDLGLFGVCVCAAILLFLLVSAYFQPRGAERALALFLITYCLLSSFTETGLSDASIYLLEVTLAASMLVPSLADRHGPVSDPAADEAMPVLLGPQRRRA